MVEVTLNRWEIAISGFVGVLRQSEAIGRKLKSKMAPENPFEIHVNGAAGEMAVAKALNLYWKGGINEFKNADIGDHIQVRCRSKDGDALIVRDGDSDTEYFVLVTGKPPSLKVIGWLRGAEAKQEKWVSNPGGRGNAYFVPQQALHPIETLPKEAMEVTYE